MNFFLVLFCLIVFGFDFSFCKEPEVVVKCVLNLAETLIFVDRPNLCVFTVDISKQKRKTTKKLEIYKVVVGMEELHTVISSDGEEFSVPLNILKEIENKTQDKEGRWELSVDCQSVDKILVVLESMAKQKLEDVGSSILEDKENLTVIANELKIPSLIKIINENQSNSPHNSTASLMRLILKR